VVYIAIKTFISQFNRKAFLLTVIFIMIIYHLLIFIYVFYFILFIYDTMTVPTYTFQDKRGHLTDSPSLPATLKRRLTEVFICFWFFLSVVE
jgi:hypothetical protein